MGGEFDDDRIEEDTTTTTTDEEKVEEPGLTEDGGALQPASQEYAQPSANTLLSSKSPLLKQKTELEDSGAVHDSLEENIIDLLESRKAGLFGKNKDSSQMDNLKTDLTGLIAIFYKKIPEARKEFETGLGEVQERYRKAIQSAERYINYITENKKGKYYFGRKRLNLARKVQKQMVTERRLFAAAAKSLNDSKQTGEQFYWRDALREVRGRKIDLKGGNVSIVGAGASRIYRVRDEGGGENYIKPEERMAADSQDYQAMVAMYRNTSPEAAALLNFLEETITELAAKGGMDTDKTEAMGEKEFFVLFCKGLEDRYDPPVAEKDPKTGRKKTREEIEAEKRPLKINMVRQKLEDNFLSKKVLEVIGDNEELLLRVAELGDFLLKKSNEAQSGKTDARIQEGSIISDRNVSSYRLAERLGQGNLIAKSETIVMKDEFGRDIRANVMEGVGGMTFDEAQEYCKENHLKLSFTPESLGQFFNLRILDLMSGQVDRHTNNFKVQTHKEGDMLYIDSVKGIDNDLAFGLMTSKQINAGLIGNHLDSIIATYSAAINGGEAVQTVKYITEDFYNSILDYNDELIEYDQIDNRSKEEIEALKDRIHGLRQTIKILVAAGKLRIVKTPEEMRAAYEESRDYYGGFAAKNSQWAYNLGTEHMLKAIH